MAWQHLLLVLLINVGWGYNFVAAKVSLDSLPVSMVMLGRFLVVTLLLLPFLRIPRGLMLPTLGIGFLLGVVHFGLMFVGTQLSGDVSSVAIAAQLFVPFGTVLAVLFLGERIRWRRTAALVVAFSGIIVLGFDPTVVNHLDSLFFIALAAVAMAVATILMRRFPGTGAMQMQAWTGVVAIPFYLLWMLIAVPDPVGIVQAAPPIALGYVVYTAIAASIIGHGSLYYLLKRYPVSTVSPLMLLSPVIGIVFGILVYGDDVTWQIAVGGVLTLAGVAVIAMRSGAKQSAATPEKAATP